MLVHKDAKERPPIDKEGAITKLGILNESYSCRETSTEITLERDSVFMFYTSIKKGC